MKDIERLKEIVEYFIETIDQEVEFNTTDEQDYYTTLVDEFYDLFSEEE